MASMAGFFYEHAMAEELGVTIRSQFDGTQVESGVAKTKRSMLDFLKTVTSAGSRSEESFKKVGDSAEGAAKNTDRAQASMRRTLEQTIARMSAAGDKAKELELRMQMRGIDTSSFNGYLAKIRELQNAQQRLSTTTQSTSVSLGSMFKPLVAGLSATAFISQLVGVQREFDRLNASLVTVTGSSAAAQAEMAWLKTFAKETPFGLAQATEAFVKMKALGLNPTKEALTSFGNTASAMGKDMMQFVEAVADASNFQFERLREFGITAEQQGNKVSLTFQGVTKTIGKSAGEITKYLEAIGNNEFASAMAERAKTLDGAIAGLGDSWDEFIRTISNSGIGDAIAGSVRSASDALDSYSQILSTVTAYQKETGQSASGVQEEFFSLSNAASNLAILTAEASHSVQDFGQKIGGLAAAGRALATDGLDAARAVIRDLDADGRAAAQRMEELRSRLLNLLVIQKNAASAIASDARGGLDAYLSGAVLRSASETRRTPPSGGGGSGKGKGRKARDQYADLADRLIDESQGLSADYSKQLAALFKQYESGALSVDKYRAAVEQLIAKQPFARDLAKEQEKAIEASDKALLKSIDTQFKSAEAYRAQTQSIRDQIDALGKSKTEMAASALARDMAEFERAADSASFDPTYINAWLAKLKEGQASVEAMKELEFREAAYSADELQRSLELGVKYAKEDLDLVFLTSDQREKVVALREIERDLTEQIYKIDKMSISESEKQTLRDKQAINARLKLEQTASRQIRDEWQKTADQINESLTDALLRGFEDGKGFAENFRDTLKNMINTLVLKPVISFVVQPIGNIVSTLINGALGSLTNGVLGNGSTLGGLVNNASSAYSAISGNNPVLNAIGNYLGWGNTLGAGQGVLAAGSPGAAGAWTGLGAGQGVLASGAPGAAGAYTGGTAGMWGSLGTAAWIAAPVAVGLWGMSSMPDRPDYSGYASASSDPTRDRAPMTASGTIFDLTEGIIPDRDALIAAMGNSGITDRLGYRVGPEERIRAGDRGEVWSAAGQAGVTGADVGRLSNRDLYGMLAGTTGQFYTGAGYVDPGSMWRDGMEGVRDWTYSAEMTQWGRQIAEGVLTSIETLASQFNLGGDFSVIAGMRDEAKRDLVYAGLRISQGDETLIDYEGKVGKGGAQEALRQYAAQTLEAFKKLDLPEWARALVDQTQTAINELDGEELGDQLGQTALTAVDQLNASLAQTVAILTRLGKTVLEFGGYSQDVIYQITQLLGGVDQFGTAYSAYVQAFYSEQEQMDLLQRQLQEQFGALGVAMPASIEGFRQLVESLDLNEEASRGLFASLLQISPQFAQFAQALDQTGSAAEDAAKAMEEALAAARKNTDGSFAAYRANQQKIIDQWTDVQTAAQETADEVRGIFDLLHDNVRELRGEVASTRAMQANQANEFISAALQAARATGVMPEYDGLSDAISGARAGLDSSRYSTRQDFERDQLILSNKLEELEGYAENQLSTAEQHLKFAKEQIELINIDLEMQQAQIEEMRQSNIWLGTLSELTSAIYEEMAEGKRIKAAGGDTARKNNLGNGYGNGGGGLTEFGQGNPYPEFATREEAAAEASRINASGEYAYFYNVGGAWRVITHREVNGQSSYDRMEDLRDSLDTVNSADEWWRNAAEMGATKDELAAALNVAPDDLQDWVKNNLPGYQWGAGNSSLEKIPSYDVGTPFVPADTLAMIHQGERILTAADNQMLMEMIKNYTNGTGQETLAEVLRVGFGSMISNIIKMKNQLRYGVITTDQLPSSNDAIKSPCA